MIFYRTIIIGAGIVDIDEICKRIWNDYKYGKRN